MSDCQSRFSSEDDVSEINDINILKNIYYCISNTSISNHEMFKHYKNLLKTHKMSITPISEEKTELVNSNHTTKRQIEINNNIKRKNQYRIRHLKLAFLIICLLTLFPILSKVGVLPKPLCGLIIFICLIIIAIYLIFMFFIKDINRDKNNFAEFNFHKPDDSEIARSKTNLKMSESDKAKCDSLAELNEDIDPSNFIVPNSFIDKSGASSSTSKDSTQTQTQKCV